MELNIPYSLGAHARVDTSDIVIVHLRLASLDDDGSVASVMYHSLKPYYKAGSAGRLTYVDIPYDLSTDIDVACHAKRMTEELHFLQKYAF